jgi:hypothetical protein
LSKLSPIFNIDIFGLYSGGNPAGIEPNVLNDCPQSESILSLDAPKALTYLSSDSALV